MDLPFAGILLTAYLRALGQINERAQVKSGKRHTLLAI